MTNLPEPISRDHRPVHLAQVAADPRNPNRMPEDRYQKLKAHVRKTSNVPICIARILPPGSRFYDRARGGEQLMWLDGHHRARVLLELGEERGVKRADLTDTVEVWGEMPDDVAGLYLEVINNNTGSDDPMAKASLYADISQTLDMASIAAVVPDSLKDIEELIALRQDVYGVDLDELPPVENPADTLVEHETANIRRFILYPAQDKVVEMALDHVMTQLEGQNKPGRSLEMLAADYLGGLSEDDRVMLAQRWAERQMARSAGGIVADDADLGGDLKPERAAPEDLDGGGEGDRDPW
ncbi:hypothetical protein [Deinococcus kurensis]|uniref:hypothetical protein n=1 Tax=Deinococcus kurensis TaxID=2662757 RepID=UPI0012D2C09F|nr:hypothetical protein [Deinococcus kurensis]